MTDLREAAQQALEALKSCSGVPHWPALQPTIGALHAALTQQDEPVEPVAWLYEAGADRTLHWHKPPLYGTPLYTAPPQRQPLTDEEINALELPPSGTATVRDLVRLIERAHGIGETK